MSKYETVAVPSIMVGNRMAFTKQTLVEMDLMEWVDRFNLDFDPIQQIYLVQEQTPNNTVGSDPTYPNGI